MLILDADLDGRLVDVGAVGGVITSVTPAGHARSTDDDDVIDAAGGAVIPGLHDHHLHLLALAAARSSLALGPPAVTDAASFDDTLARAARTGAGWIRGVGYHESVAGPLDRERLDRLAPQRPTRVQHRTGAMWVMNTAGLRRTGLETSALEGVERAADGDATGRLFRLDDVVRDRVGPAPPDLAAVGRELAAYGVTAVTDMTPTDDTDELAVLARGVADDFPLRVVVTGGPDLDPRASPVLARGAVKFVLDERRLPPLDVVIAGFRRARRMGRAIAVHCVSRVELVVALTAWDDVGAEAGDRIEHGAVIPLELVDDVARHGLTVVTQPSFVAEKGDQFLAEVEPDDIDGLWRCGSLLARSVPVAGSTDAPFGSANPWHAVAAAADRRTPSGTVLGAAERITTRRALELFLTPVERPAGPVRRIDVGAPADLCVLTTDLATALRNPTDVEVVLTHSPMMSRPD